MSLLRLLTKGKSWSGTHDTGSRYRMRKANLLPKFGGKNPFALPAPGSQPSGKTTQYPSSRLETGSLFESSANEPAPAPAPREIPRPAPVKEIKSLPKRPANAVTASAPAKVEAKPTPSPSPAPLLHKKQGPARWTTWVEKFNPLSLLPHRTEGNRGRPTRKHIQAELTLEKVRVVRNDLSETDLEIVPGRLMGMPSSASPILPHPANAGSGAWGRLTSKLLGAQHAETR
jgi:hypothetical protein